MRTERERERGREGKKKSEVIGLHAVEVQKRKKRRMGFERVSDHLIALQRRLKFHCSLVYVCVCQDTSPQWTKTSSW